MRFDQLPAKISASGLSDDEGVVLQILSGEVWQDVVDEAGNRYDLKGPTTIVQIPGPGWYRVDKDATAEVANVILHTKTIILEGVFNG